MGRLRCTSPPRTRPRLWVVTVAMCWILTGTPVSVRQTVRLTSSNCLYSLPLEREGLSVFTPWPSSVINGWRGVLGTVTIDSSDPAWCCWTILTYRDRRERDSDTGWIERTSGEQR